MTIRNLDIQEMQAINGGGPLTNLLGGLTNILNNVGNVTAVATVGVGIGVQTGAGNIAIGLAGTLGLSIGH